MKISPLSLLSERHTYRGWLTASSREMLNLRTTLYTHKLDRLDSLKAPFLTV